MNEEKTSKEELEEKKQNISQDSIKEESISVNQTDLQEELNEEKDKFLRLYAEFDNYKKRSQKEKIDLIKYGSKEILSSLLPVIDDLERAIKEIEKHQENIFLSGVQLIQNKFFNILKDNGLKKMNIKIGDEFDSDKHEAISQIVTPNNELKGKIVDIIETGYLLHNKIIRFAKVIVGN